MYIKLGNITVNLRRSIDDFMIFAEVIDSTMSFERPVIVRNPEQLDIWFGKSFSDRVYFVELLKSGVSLYLYKPISTETGMSDSEYINLDDYAEYKEEKVFYSISELPIPGDPTIKYKVYENTYYIYVNNEYVLLEGQPGTYNKYMEPKSFADPESLPKSGEEGVKYKVDDPNTWFIWIDSWVCEEEFPQNLVNTSISLNNRDVLALTDSSIENLPEYIYPEYNEYVSLTEDHLGLFSSHDNNIPNIVINDNIAKYEGTNVEVNIDSDSIQDGITTLAIQEFLESETVGDGIQIVEDIVNSPPENIAISSNQSRSYIVYNGIRIPPGDLYSQIANVDPTDIDLDKFKSVFSEAGYFGMPVENDGIGFYSYKPFNLTYLCTFDSIKLVNDVEHTRKILTQMFMPFVNVGMWSKTIGRDSEKYSEDKNIKVKIDEIGLYEYRFTITRFDYSETFEGSLFPDPGQSRIDDIITTRSNLVYCEIKEGTMAIRTGEFTLRGAVVENYNETKYWKSLEELFRDEVYPDYFLIPNISKYLNSSEPLDIDYNYYKEYETFLNLAQEHNLQVLVQNNDYKLLEVDELPTEYDEFTVYKLKLGEEEYEYYFREKQVIDQRLFQYLITLTTIGNDYIFNYNKDKENRLVYFFRDMTSYLSSRPGYYIYILGLLNNIFSASPDDIVYDTPVSYPYDLDLNVVRVSKLPNVPRTDTVYIIVIEGKTHYYLGPKEITDQKLIDAVNDEEIKESLEKYKSNYMVFNNQMYYYRDYKNGEDYDEDATTAWMRFAVGKIYRELQKNKWNYLSLKSVGKIRENILAVLSRITGSFSVVNSINLTRFYPVMSENRIEITLDTTVADLVDNNIVLDLTINYNKED